MESDEGHFRETANIILSPIHIIDVPNENLSSKPQKEKNVDNHASEQEETPKTSFKLVANSKTDASDWDHEDVHIWLKSKGNLFDFLSLCDIWEKITFFFLLRRTSSRTRRYFFIQFHQWCFTTKFN